MPGRPQIPDYNPYQGATYDQMARYLSAKSGLDYNVARNWLMAEGSKQAGNPLGVNYSAATGPRLYPNWQAGLDAAVSLIQSKYAGVVAAIKTGSPAAERQAIIASPWATGRANDPRAYGGGAGFSAVGIEALGAPLGAFDNRVSFPVGHTLTGADVDQILKVLDAGGYFSNDVIAGAFARGTVGDTLRRHIGEPWSKSLEDKLQVEFGGAATAVKAGLDIPAAAGQAVADLFGTMFAWVPGFTVDAGILLLIAILGWKGLRAVLELD